MVTRTGLRIRTGPVHAPVSVAMLVWTRDRSRAENRQGNHVQDDDTVKMTNICWLIKIYYESYIWVISVSQAYEWCIWVIMKWMMVRINELMSDRFSELWLVRFSFLIFGARELIFISNENILSLVKRNFMVFEINLI